MDDSVISLAGLLRERQPCVVLTGARPAPDVVRTTTPFDDRASVRIDGGAGETLAALADAVAC